MNSLHKQIILIVVFVLIVLICAHADMDIKPPNVSGQFYDSNAARLRSQIGDFFAQSNVSAYDRHIDVVVAPHAGYKYSGGVAAYSFKAASQQSYSTIVVLAPSHYFRFDGISIWNQGGFQTPLGVLNVDSDFVSRLIAEDSQFYFNPDVFDKEHSLEVELPFIQETFPEAKIVPVVFGQTSFELLEQFARSLNKLIGKRTDVLVVVSTDLSHYHTDQKARVMDAQALEAVKNLQAKRIYKECQTGAMEMCGCIPVVASILYAKEKKLNQVDVLKYANSGDVTSDKTRVVGYASVVMYSDAIQSKEQKLTFNQKKELMRIARNSLDVYLNTGKMTIVQSDDPRLNEWEGAFVSIYNKGRLRGCIGNIIGQGPLCKTVQNMTVASASQDKRFEPVQKEEWPDLSLEISVLSKPKVISDISAIDLGRHGVIISQERQQGVFLPQVADSTGWSKEEFLSQLCSQKAGLPRDCWKDPKTKIEIFTADVFKESDLKDNE